MTRIIRQVILGAAAISAASLSFAALPAQAATPGWQVSYRLPAQNGTGDIANAVAATGPRNAWAAGGKLAIVNKQAEGVPAVFHWNGKSWSQVTLPGPVHVGYFSAVSAPSAKDVWAIGGCQSGCTEFAANWNGTKWTWHTSVATTPDTSMAAFSPSDVWVADYTQLDRWTGRSWRRYKAPGWNGVWALSGVAGNNIWAAGLAVGGLQPEALHWNGSSWKPARLPTISLPVNGEAVPASVTAESASNAWLAGTVEWPDPTTGLTDYRPLVLHWNGATWRQVSVPASFPADFGLAQLTQDGTGGFWAVAQQPSASGTTTPEDLVHYSHRVWTVSRMPSIRGSVASPAPSVTGLASVPGTQQIWAPVLYQAKSGQFLSAILRYVH